MMSGPQCGKRAGLDAVGRCSVKVGVAEFVVLADYRAAPGGLHFQAGKVIDDRQIRVQLLLDDGLAAIPATDEVKDIAVRYRAYRKSHSEVRSGYFLAMLTTGGVIGGTDSTTQPLTFFVDDATGKDTNNGLSFGTPFKTLFPLKALRPFFIRHTIRTLCGPGQYVWDPVDTHDYSAFITFEADENRPGVFTTLATVTAGAGTTSGLLKFGGNVTDFGGKFIEVLTGPANGERRTVRDNLLAVQNDPTSAFDPENIAPAAAIAGIVPGNQFRLFETNVFFVTPEPPAGAGVVPQFGWFQGAVTPSGEGTTLPPAGGVALVGVALDSGVPDPLSFTLHSFGEMFYFMYGVEFSRGGKEADGDRHNFQGACKVNMGAENAFLTLEGQIPEIPSSKWQGWGVTSRDLGGPATQDPSGEVFGFQRSSGRLNAGVGATTYAGGYATQLFPIAGGAGKIVVFGNFFAPGTFFFLDAGAVNTPALDASFNEHLIQLGAVMMRKGAGLSVPLVKVSRRTQLELFGGSSFPVIGEHPDVAGGGRTVLIDAEGGAVLGIFGAVTLGSATTDDWEIDGAPSLFQKADLASVGDQVFFEGNRAKRIS